MSDGKVFQSVGAATEKDLSRIANCTRSRMYHGARLLRALFVIRKLEF